MAWKEVSIMSQRHEFVILAQQERANIKELCQRFKISRKTGYKWLKRFKEEQEAGLVDQSKRPKHSPLQTSLGLEQLIAQARNAHPAWGARKIKALLVAQGHNLLPAPSTFTRIFVRQNCAKLDTSKPSKPWIRFEHEAPNELWQIDFKGHFPLEQGLCHPLTVLDDHSRFNLGLRACANEDTPTVQHQLTSIFRRYGLPQRMTMDNGPPWGNVENKGYTQLTLWLIRLGIALSHSKPYHPQTQGKNERFHRTLKAELLHNRLFKNLKHCQTHFDKWREVYNLQRPHQALDMKPPASRYSLSHRAFPEKLPPIEYAQGDIVRKIQDHGQLHYLGKVFRIGSAFKGYPVALRFTHQQGVLDVFFCHQKISQISLLQPINLT